LNFGVRGFFAITSFVLCLSACASHAAGDPQAAIRNVVDTAVRPIMQKYRIPGMAVGIIVGEKHYVFNYGLAVMKAPEPVTRDTLFEVGSISKTFTATLACYAQVTGHLSLRDTTSKYLPSLQGTKFGDVSLLHLGTHTPGGLPLQVPDNIQTDDQLMDYFKSWQPAYKPGTYRTYNNLGIGTLGLITAKSMNESFATLMERLLFRPLGMTSTFINIPKSRMSTYAQGYTQDDRPIRMAPGELSAEAYGIRTTAADMLRFLEANLNLITVNGKLRRAIADTHTSYFTAGGMTQDLIWEQYRYPVALQSLLEGNSSAMIFDATPVTEIIPPQRPRKDVWLNKTGSTNGFGAYVAFVPSMRLGIVIFANKSFPIEERVTAAYKIVNSLSANVH
jgi:beta-lactamase class C